jgi:hypothetical protein
LSADGSRVAIGASYNDGDPGASYNDGFASFQSDAGHVRVYQLVSGNIWAQLGADIDGEAAGDWSGSSVHLNADGSKIAIGAPANVGAGAWAGHVRVYQYLSGSWSQLGSDIDAEAAGDTMGVSVSFSDDGSKLAVGAPGNKGSGTGAGHVRVYQFINSNWAQLGSDIDGEFADDGSGSSVSLSADGSRVAIGAPANDGSGSDAGHVRVYQFLTPSPTTSPTFQPSSLPTFQPSSFPTLEPSIHPTVEPSESPSTIPTFRPSTATVYSPRCPIFLPGGITLPGCQIFNTRSSSICYAGNSGLRLVHEGNPVSSCLSLAGSSCGATLIQLEDTSATGCQWSDEGQYWAISTSHTLACAPTGHVHAYPFFDGSTIGVPSNSAFCSQLARVCSVTKNTLVAVKTHDLTDPKKNHNENKAGSNVFLRARVLRE